MPASVNASLAASKLVARASQHVDDAPHAMERLHTEGTLPHEGIYDESVRSARDFAVMRDAAFAWRITGDKRYLDQVDRFLKAWSSTYQPSFNPIDETKFDGLIQAYILVRDALTPSTRQATQNLLRTFAEGYIAHSDKRNDPGKPRTSLTWVNNWQSHRVKLLTLSASALQDSGLMAEANRLFRQQIADNVRVNGSVEDFEDRDALHYVVYDLEPLTMAAIAARPYGYDWLNLQAHTGANLASAMKWLVHYANGSRTHEEYVHTHVAFDKKRADAGVPGFVGQWEPKSAATLYWQTSLLDPAYKDLAQKLSATPPDWLALCTGL